MANATYTFEVDWSGDGNFGGAFPLTFPITWDPPGETIASNRQRAIRCRRGRDEASQLTGRSIGGSLTATLDNRSGDYNSFNGSSPIAGNVVPGKLVRLLASSVAQTNKPIWQGYLKTILPQPLIVGGDIIARLEAHGALAQINVNEMALAMRTSETTDVTIGAILDEIGWPSALRSLDTGKTTLTRYWTNRRRPLGAMQEIEAAEGGFLWEDNAGNIQFDNRHARLSGASLTSQATFSDANGAALAYSTLEQADPLATLFNIFSAAVTIFTAESIATLWTLAAVGVNSVSIQPGGAFTWWASYPSPTTSLDGGVGVDAWTTPASATDWNFNAIAGGGGTNLTASMAIVATKFGNAMKMVFTNNSAVPAFIQDLKARGTAITAGNPIVIREEDTTSQTTYNVEREWPLPSQWIPGTQEAFDWTQFNLSIYKDPIPRLKMMYHANRSEAMLDQMISREIGDRITVVALNDADLDINSDFFIESIDHDIRSSTDHRVTYLLSDAEQFSDFWVLDTSKLDSQTRLAY
jgi:hypothetical protein